MVGSRFGAVRLILISLGATMGCSQTSLVDEVSSTAAVSCGVSDLLVPECGAWFGASTPSADGTYDYVRGLDEYEAVAQNEPDVLHLYQRGAGAFPTNEHKALAERPGHQRSLLYFSWKPAPALTWRQIADGEVDEVIAEVALGLVDYPHTMFLTVHHEPENEVIDEPGSGQTPADFVAMYRHVVTRLRALGVDNVVFVMAYTGFGRWADIVEDLYPGDDVVDWVAYDPYGFKAHSTFARLLNDPVGDWPGFYDWATQQAPGKPIMVAEWGFQLEQQPDAPEILEAASSTLRSKFPMIKALVYWNDRGDQVDARLDPTAEVARRFAEMYARLAGDPYFNGTSTESAP